MTIKLYLLKLTLHGSVPTIWRRFAVPNDISLDRLHDVIQIVMGWKDYHLHEFFINGARYTEDPESLADGVEDGGSQLGDLVTQQGATFTYQYDFGDSWMHHIALEETDTSLERVDAPIMCLEGARACPPEDVGGVPGYEEFCSAIADRNHPRHEEYTEWYASFDWYDKNFDPERFDCGIVNLELLKYLRWSRPRLIPWQVPGKFI